MRRPPNQITSVGHYGGGAIFNFTVEEIRAANQQIVACAVRSILSEEAAAGSFIARKVWPDADDIEAAGSIRNKSSERRFPRGSGDKTGVVEECPCPARQAMNRAVMAIVLLSVAVRGPRPVI
jgi:hypothetical protein